MYKKIINPVSGRLVNVKGSVGRKVLKNYMYQSQSGGGWFDDINPFGGDTEEVKEVKRVESNQNKLADAITTLEKRLNEWRQMDIQRDALNIEETVVNRQLERLRSMTNKLSNRTDELQARANELDQAEEKSNICSRELEELKKANEQAESELKTANEKAESELKTANEQAESELKNTTEQAEYNLEIKCTSTEEAFQNLKETEEAWDKKATERIEGLHAEIDEILEINDKTNQKFIDEAAKLKESREKKRELDRLRGNNPQHSYSRQNTEYNIDNERNYGQYRGGGNKNNKKKNKNNRKKSRSKSKK